MEIAIPPPPAGEVSESAFDAIARAASVAQDAADQASAAAAAIGIKGAVATKAAATAAAASSAAATWLGSFQFQLPSMYPLVDGNFVPSGPPSVSSRLHFQVDPAKIDPNYNFDASARARENLAIMKANFLEMTRGVTGAFDGTIMKGITGALDGVEGGSASTNAAAAASTLTAVISSLHLKEFGGWYAAAFTGAYALTQRSAGREEATEAYESELAAAKERASEAASAAGLAAEGAKTATMLAIRMERDMMKDGGKALLASSRSKMAEVEKASVFFFLHNFFYLTKNIT
ncbi:hypothetical protein ACHAXA_011206 [Cyclostephanos tholiformis]|uniref:Uncharacterized protein n=1 Tax=Cyclostephanos tholiformis TaxID=382380 RepID=A0ABD3RF59_9STRA